MTDFTGITACDAVSGLKAGDFSAESYLDFLLARCEAHGALNAFITLDAEGARRAARHADAKRATGATLGKLHGLPLALKDNIDTAHLPTSGGTPALRNQRPGNNAPVAQALLDAGAVLIGKTNMHELAFGITTNNAAFGATRNPYAPDKIPGGSSGGTGAAVVGGLVPAGLGTDTGGSVRVPAALCGIVGFRPTVGRYPGTGIVPISHTRDTAGPMARTVGDIVLLDGVLAGRGGDIEPATLAGLRLGVPRGYFYENLDPQVGTLAERELERLRDLGVVLVETDIPDVGKLNEATSFPVALYEVVTDLRAYLRDGGSGLTFEQLVEQVASPDVSGLLTSLLGDGAMPEPVYRQALDETRPALQETYRNYFRSNDLAAVIFPTTPLPTRPIGEDETVTLNGEQVPTFTTFIRNTDPSSNAGIPGLSLPIGTTEDGLPVGIELDGPAGRDESLLAIALAVEASAPAMPPPRL
ncbi:MAG: indoleacetamide hydrolase [SAR324 cluster bacterium]|nr:indoleacetamide hydrolase [SAR324 cluster bacterium]